MPGGNRTIARRRLRRRTTAALVGSNSVRDDIALLMIQRSPSGTA